MAHATLFGHRAHRGTHTQAEAHDFPSGNGSLRCFSGINSSADTPKHHSDWVPIRILARTFPRWVPGLPAMSTLLSNGQDPPPAGARRDRLLPRKACWARLTAAACVLLTITAHTADEARTRGALPLLGRRLGRWPPRRGADRPPTRVAARQPHRDTALCREATRSESAQVGNAPG